MDAGLSSFISLFGGWQSESRDGRTCGRSALRRGADLTSTTCSCPSSRTPPRGSR